MPNLEQIRHSLAHLIALAAQELDPQVKFGIGPVTEQGCYYDFQFSHKIGEEILAQLTNKIQAAIKANLEFTQETKSITEARHYFEDQHQDFKLELLDDLEQYGTTEHEAIQLIQAGKQTAQPVSEASLVTVGAFTDLCRGGHVTRTSEIPTSFKLTHLAGAYWRGSEKNSMLTRVYAVAFATPLELDQYLEQLEQARQRDHRKLGQELDLFVFSDLVGAGLPLWTARGTIVRNLLDEYIWELRQARGYQRVTIPHITKKELYETSGHWEKFQSELFKIKTREGHEFCMKPMNCPHHAQIYASQKRSYRDLPQRYAETTTCYRDEQTGELHGLSRVRSFTQDDAHVFCRTNQVAEEIIKIWEIVDIFYTSVGFDQLKVRLSLHDPNHFENYLGTPELWTKAEADLRSIAQTRQANFSEALGEAAFYGPKVDFIARDSIGRDWQVATIQLDINMPERFNLTCVNEAGQNERIVMIHAAIMGSLERFLATYLEHTAGNLPLWLAPVQVVLIPIAATHLSIAQELAGVWRAAGIRVEVAEPDETLSKRIRTTEQLKVPYLAIIGDREQISGQVAVRRHGGADLGTITSADFLAQLKAEIANRQIK